MFIYKRSTIAKGIVKNVGKESNLSGERAGRKDEDPSFTEFRVCHLIRWWMC